MCVKTATIKLADNIPSKIKSSKVSPKKTCYFKNKKTVSKSKE